MQKHALREVDVFGAHAYGGNPLAVVHGADGLDAARMQQFASWTNLSETTFLLAPTDPQADYQVRIFTPFRELPFAGHPTLGSCHAWLAAGGRPARNDRIVQQCRAGLIALRRAGGRLAFQAPRVLRSSVEPGLLEKVCTALGLPRARLRASQWLENGPRWLGILVDDANTVLALDPDFGAMRALADVGLIGPIDARQAGAGEASADFEVRAFVPTEGINEDPVTGSLNAALGQWLHADRIRTESYVVSQGARLGRAGRVYIQQDEDGTWVAGDCADCILGTVVL